MKICVIGGGSVRTPLLVHGMLAAGKALPVKELALYDPDRERLALVAGLCEAVAAELGRPLALRTPQVLDDAVRDARFVIASIRVGGIAARARDERTAIGCGLVGQETTGPGGMAMALRTIPVLLEQARAIERCAPEAWLINFTNPAGLISQALMARTGVRTVGICDTPIELFHGLAAGLGVPVHELRCDYVGLNHLGWVRRVLARDEDVTARVLADDALLRGLYPADLLAPELIRGLGMIPNEYLFFYYNHQRALQNQRRVGRSRGEELEQLNAALSADLEELLARGDGPAALARYRDYLNRRNASYMQLEAEAGSALTDEPQAREDPFAAATGYHRMAVQVISALCGARPAEIVVNVQNRGALLELADDDVVELRCRLDAGGVTPLPAGPLPDAVRGLLLAVKAYERLVIRAALEADPALARLALLLNPLVGDWELARRVTDALIAGDPQHLGYLAR